MQYEFFFISLKMKLHMKFSVSIFYFSVQLPYEYLTPLQAAVGVVQKVTSPPVSLMLSEI